MGEENGVQIRTPNGDMAPQEDSSKVPLTDGTERKIEVKEAGEEKIDIPDDDLEFKGLTKEELLQYAKEPFWVRLRIFLMVLFWAGWLAMLVLAVLIIVQAPSCEPPPTISWLQESPLLEVDMQATPKADDVTSLMSSLGLSSFYLPNLISNLDFSRMNLNYDHDAVRVMLEAMSVAKMRSVTDFVPSPVPSGHVWAMNSSYSDVFLSSSSYELDYKSELLDTELRAVFRHWKEGHVTGFLVPQEELDTHPDLHNLTVSLNDNLSPDQIVIGENTVNLNTTLLNLNIPGNFKQFLMDNVDEWKYYKFNPVSELHSTAAPALMPGVTLSLMLLPGTPILQMKGSSTPADIEQAVGPVVRKCAELRETDAIKFGETQFVNSTDPDVIAFTRTLKGTPGYAVAVNLGSQNETVEVDFSKLNFLPELGILAYSLADGESSDSTKIPLNSVKLAKHSGLVIQFVANY